MKHQIIGIIGVLIGLSTAYAGTEAVSDSQDEIKLRQMADRIPSNCRVAATRDINGQPVFLWQYTFTDGTRDLVMATSLEGRLQGIRRVTYGGSQTAGCHFPLLAIARGGNWGWHLAWMRMRKGLFYARMDGEAWVSSPPKRMTTADVTQVELLTNDSRVSLSWLELANNISTPYQMVSDDDGRFWSKR
ncbi:hypothetical protein LG201_13775 [Methylobacillus gramineus]|uniref:hypothetical protein n=1 Tax=Methylobacillus gramineus TaxID=755169 RepID=UPI001CFFABA5|nr:hypothetical protein [Methylobacillus gramineus]MCB5186279.1 hypothetical protein [Methylobacillus gramineus]